MRFEYLGKKDHGSEPVCSGFEGFKGLPASWQLRCALPKERSASLRVFPIELHKPTAAITPLIFQNKKAVLFRVQLFMFRLFTYRINADLSLISTETFESNSAFCDCKERIVLANLNVQARMEMGASLANDDVARFSDLTCVHFGSQALRIGVAAVLCAGNTFFMSE